MLLYVKKGQHDFRPINQPFELPLILNSNRKFRWEFSFDKSCLYNHQNDNDLKWDWNKGGGVSLSLFDNTKNSAIWAFRANYENGTISVAPYFNSNSGIVQPWNGDIQEFYPDQKGEATIWREKRKWFVKIKHITNQAHIQKAQTLKAPWVVKTIGAWFGGYDNDQNALGGVAPQDMKMYSKFYL